ncbi:unnamed protein product [Peronospora belbahrii]|uniref:Uncharacterized protein n=1 Tax=Peronospora belbahrii TaxID=622444 RepID=A0ABN8D554_9STRA|nr:unnamed protein product [Peronospora belbahrii]
MNRSFSKEFMSDDLLLSLDDAMRIQSYRVDVTERRMDIGEWICRCRHYLPDDVYSCEFEYRGSRPITPTDWVRMLKVIHAEFSHEKEYRYVLSRDTMAQLRHAARPVKDVKMIPASDNSYRVKVDGEHAWVFDAGSAWYVCRNDPNLTVVNYVIKSDVEEFTGFTNVLRVEQLVDGSMVLIDIIVANGVVQIITRKYDEYRRIIGEILIPPSVIIRKEYSTFEEAEKARLTDGLPSDGVIIIEKNTSITYRIKKPTIDLLCYRDDMQILLQGRRRMHVCAGLPGMKSGTIYECNVEPDEEDNLRVVRAIPRTDEGLELVDKRYGSRFLNPWLLYSRSWREEGLSVHITEEAPNPYSLLTRLSSSFVSVATPSCTPSHFLIWWKRLIGWLLPGSNRLDVATFMTGSVEDGVLIDLGGISMKMHPDKPGYAVAKYGSKVEYVEPAVRTRDFRATKMSYATDVIYGDCEIGSDTLQIVRNILVVSSF